MIPKSTKQALEFLRIHDIKKTQTLLDALTFLGEEGILYTHYGQ